MSSILLVDCNNFFASCEILFDPKLRGKILVVLSSNDGCVIARSKEAKELGIPMGMPAFELPKHKPIIQRSSNFSLYGDMSARVMSVIKSFGCPLEIYSIDEAFIKAPPELAPLIRQKVMQWTGIPVSVGVAPTKTLAKLAGTFAKKKSSGVQIYDPHLLTDFPVEKIWGIGSQLTKKLHAYNIRTASALINTSDTWIKKQLTVTGLRLVYELRGTPSITLSEVHATRKSIICSRSFGHHVTNKKELSDAACTFAATAAVKLRKDKLYARHLTVFTSENSSHITLPTSTNDTPELLSYVRAIIEETFQKDTPYKKAGIMLSDLTKRQELDFFAKRNHTPALHVFDQINQRFGKKTLYFGSEGTAPAWKPKQQNCSPKYTTDWNELPKIP
ncbi:MAG: Protein UmuC [Chlamydiia bacterium]|nr:Protein UmuC [Chlamydiia bacterium]MCH9615677.1 Protein UmuC [Chlamydiia bacterium]MCH9628920.1 Protein UmuC [Chlamydiia bacterium]